jgi:hypothetical protein
VINPDKFAHREKEKGNTSIKEISKEADAMNAIKELTSEQLRDIYCVPENTDDPESIDFDYDEPEERDFDGVKLVETVESFEERNDENVREN